MCMSRILSVDNGVFPIDPIAAYVHNISISSGLTLYVHSCVNMHDVIFVICR